MNVKSPPDLVSVLQAFSDPVAIAAGIAVGVTSSVIPYVFDQLAMARLARATYALFVALLPATATVIGVIVLQQLPSLVDLAGIALVMAGIAALTAGLLARYAFARVAQDERLAAA